MPVRVTAAKMEEVPEVIGANSLTEPALTIDVKTLVSGKIRSVYVDIGRVVSTGDRLVELDPILFVAALKSAEDDLAKAKTDLENNRLAWERTSVLYAEEVVAKVTLEAAKLTLDIAQDTYTKAQEALALARYNLQHVVVTAPQDGVIMKRSTGGTTTSTTVERIVGPGEIVGAGEILLSLGDIRSIMVVANVPEEKVGNVHLGQKAEVIFDAYRQTVFPGDVVKIDPQTNADKRTFKAYVKLDGKVLSASTKEMVPESGVIQSDPGREKRRIQSSKQDAQKPPQESTAPSIPARLKLTPGLAAYTRIFNKRLALTIPRTALIKDANEAAVFVVEDSRARIKRVRTGVELLHTVEVLSGLKVGDQVVSYGLLALKNNDLVNLQVFKNSEEIQEPNGKNP